MTDPFQNEPGYLTELPEDLKRKRAELAAKELEANKSLAEKFAKLQISIPIQMGEDGKAFGAVTARYVRLWSNGSTVNIYNHYVEVEVYSGTGGATATATSTAARATATATAWSSKTGASRLRAATAQRVGPASHAPKSPATP